MSNDYFELLGLKESFDIDIGAMERSYIEIQGKFHPDCFVSAKDKELASSHIEEVNRAYLVLKSPVKRAEYMLKGIMLSDRDRQAIVQEVFDIEDSEARIEDEISRCFASMKDCFANSDKYKAAQHLEKIKYLSRLRKGDS